MYSFQIQNRKRKGRSSSLNIQWPFAWTYHLYVLFLEFHSSDTISFLALATRRHSPIFQLVVYHHSRRTGPTNYWPSNSIQMTQNARILGMKKPVNRSWLFFFSISCYFPFPRLLPIWPQQKYKLATSYCCVSLLLSATSESAIVVPKGAGEPIKPEVGIISTA